ncbi:H-NS histone family protein [Burkholderia cenocepacia]|uniref:H-NS histone family protein n=1 Tax=Burkholderia cenocepacia TaxID=95486 RepID=UPI00222E8977|nr:H-NS histone family protein [Burkholderia cenocepacia]MCW3609106.1 H-NS histone family protein [Burkholderia cenocepacia]MCW5189940.1 H-NS histone family protein [Burkholderia cenocepacia]
MAESTRTYAQAKAELEKLQQEVEALRQKEVATIVAEIREKVAEYGLTAQDIFGRKRSGSASTPIAPKYRHPKTGATWSGRGKPPSWIAGVKNRDRFLIQE